MKPLLKKILLWGLVIDAAILLLVLVINLPLFDEEIDPQLRVALAQSSAPAMDNNAFILMVGFTAPNTNDHLGTARELARARYQQGYNGPNPETAVAWKEAEKHDLEWISALPQLNCVSRKDPTCINQLAKEFDTTTHNNPRLTLLKHRYLELIQSENIDESAVQNWEAPLPEYGLISKVANVYRAALIQANNTQALLDFIQQDTKFWRMTLDNSQLVVGKMVATSQLATLALLTNQLMLNGKLQSEHIAFLKTSFTPLSHSELDIGNAVRAEHLVAQRLGLYLFNGNQTGPNQNWIQMAFSQQHATQNDYFKYLTQPVLQVLSLESAEFATAVKQFSVPYDKYHLNPAIIYNPVGKKLVSQSIYTQQETFPYSARARDLDGIFRLLNIHFLIIEGVDVSEAIKVEAYQNPYFQTPMSYDDQNNKIYFECLSKNFFDCELSCGLNCG